MAVMLARRRYPRLHACLTVLLVLALTGIVVSWVVLIEDVQNWATERSAKNAFEVRGRVEAGWWLFRIAMPILAVVFWRIQRNLVGTVAVVRSAAEELVAVGLAQQRPAVTGESTDHPPRPSQGLRSLAILCTFIAWFLLAGYHFVLGIGNRIDDWPVYRMNSGSEVLPNISFANRDVIRFVAQHTPPDAKIFVLSDQAVYFLAYYLLPRKLYHRMHPNVEFAMPASHEPTRANAYRLEDLPAGYLDELSPDFVLEYFETPQYAAAERTTEDKRWLDFQRHRLGPDYVPEIVVVLKPYQSGTER